MTARCFHLVTPDAWAERGGAAWRPPSLEAEGFLHASTAAQLAGTLAVHYANAGPLLLLELDVSRAGDALRFEPSRGGEDFPHLYGALEPEDVARWWRLAGPEDRGLPRLGAEPAADDPPRTPGAP